MKMLIVDDSRMVTDVIGPMIHKQKPDLELHTANTFADASKYISENNDINYLVTDYFLDKGTLGIDLIDDCKDCHSILISSKDVSEQAKKANADFLFKSSGWLDKRIIAWMDEIETLSNN